MKADKDETTSLVEYTTKVQQCDYCQSLLLPCHSLEIMRFFSLFTSKFAQPQVHKTQMSQKSDLRFLPTSNNKRRKVKPSGRNFTEKQTNKLLSKVSDLEANNKFLQKELKLTVSKENDATETMARATQISKAVNKQVKDSSKAKKQSNATRTKYPKKMTEVNPSDSDTNASFCRIF
jgi:hypothetical protein